MLTVIVSVRRSGMRLLNKRILDELTDRVQQRAMDFLDARG
jgi:hypothetical protein